MSIVYFICGLVAIFFFGWNPAWWQAIAFLAIGVILLGLERR